MSTETVEATGDALQPLHDLLKRNNFDLESLICLEHCLTKALQHTRRLLIQAKKAERADWEAV